MISVGPRLNWYLNGFSLALRKLLDLKFRAKKIKTQAPSKKEAKDFLAPASPSLDLSPPIIDNLTSLVHFSPQLMRMP